MRHAERSKRCGSAKTVARVVNWFGIAALSLCANSNLNADEARLSPYTPKLVGQEQFAYVWTGGIDGVGDGADKLVTVDVNPASPGLGKVIHVLTMGEREQPETATLTDDRRYLWASSRGASFIYVFDVRTNPTRPSLHRVIQNAKSNGMASAGPFGMLALPGRMLVSMVSNTAEAEVQSLVLEYRNGGEFVARHGLPRTSESPPKSDASSSFGLSIAALNHRKVLITTSVAPILPTEDVLDRTHFLANDKTASKLPNAIVIRDLRTRTPKQVLEVFGAPVALSCADSAQRSYCFAITAQTSRIWLVFENDERQWQAIPVADLNDASLDPFAIDLSLSANRQLLWVNSWASGTTYAFDVSDIRSPRRLFGHKIGAQLSKTAQSSDGNRLYFTSSLRETWDKRSGKPGEVQFFKAFTLQAQSLEPMFSIDFEKEGLGRPVQAQFGSFGLYPPPPASQALTNAAQ